uniref:Uncharacterized protein n=1 Tax=Panagrellus redivivus TaxID=6233 RepID=A0A7E4VWC6_PANRE
MTFHASSTFKDCDFRACFSFAKACNHVPIGRHPSETDLSQCPEIASLIRFKELQLSVHGLIGQHGRKALLLSFNQLDFI